MTAWPDIKGVLFDLDGTLADTEGVAIEAWVAVAAEKGFPLEAALFETFAGLDDEATAALLAPHVGGHAAGLALYRDFHAEQVRRLASGVPLKPGAVAALDDLDRRGLPYGLVTTSTRVEVGLKLPADLRARLATVVTFDDVTHRKPHPEPYLRGAAGLGIDPAQALAVEDSNAGLTAALAAGAQVAVVVDRHRPKVPDNPRVRCVTDGLPAVWSTVFGASLAA